tara:strand:- start:813 stop:1190 length:378 start_codon:yes stop_codon:yes gene_type:complete
MYKRHGEGLICELILTEYLLQKGFYVFRPQAGFGPVDVIGISGVTGKVYLFDAKKEKFRKINRTLKGDKIGVRGSKKAYGPYRIYRVLSKEQKLLDVRIAYVNMDTREVDINPPIAKEDIEIISD